MQTAFCRKRHQGGFTLIEVMITVVIVGILSAVALPAYTSYIQKSRRTEARTVLMDAASKQEQYILNFRTYTTSMTALGYAANPALSETGLYSVAAAAGACGSIARCYTLTATAVAGKGQDKDIKCKSFSLDSTGAKTSKNSSDAATTDCWN
ncbi:type IV pilin protein [Hydrogenophaga atypica]|uniref:Type IV pilin protein n=1 Tax=Hydrogenophaga atypica TaxID=249409 RepID=A0ABW2QL65_9BURK